MALYVHCLGIDAIDPLTLAHWWADVLGWQITAEEDGEVLLEPQDDGPASAGEPALLFLQVPERKTVKNRLHLDLRPDDQAAEVARVETLGAKRVDIGQTNEESWVVLADPEGNEFCILRPRTSEELAGAND